MVPLTLQLLGGFRISREGEAEIAPLGKKTQALLAYLALSTEQRHTREKLATLLWGDRPEEQARHSLRQTVLALRKALDDEDASIVVSEGDRLSLNTEAVEIDVRAFERLAAENTREALEQAAALYGGELLEDLNVRSEGFDEWLALERSRLRDLAVDALGRLAIHYAEAGESETAIETARHLLTLDPLREEAHRMLMRLYENVGRRSAALRQYQICEEALRRELDAEPEPETVRLYSEIRTRRTEAEDALDVAETAEGAEGELAAGQAQAGPKAPGGRPGTALARLLSRRQWRLTAAAAAAFLVLAGGGFWALYLRGPELLFPPLRKEKLVFPLPEKPSIAVLPFQNLSGDPARENFIDGITEGITTALSIMSEMFVIARTSALTYKGKPVNVQQVAEKLGVRYLLEGSVQSFGDRVRISAQLIDAVEGYHVWAERYDREVKDVFALQDEITLKIVTALQVEITEGEQERISLIHGTGNLQSWVLAGQGLQLLRRLTREDNAKARNLYGRAIQLDPNYPGAWDGLAWTHFLDARFGWSASREESMRRAAELAQKTLALDPGRPRTYGLLGSAMLMKGDHDQAVALGEKAVALNPNGADVAALLGFTLTYAGELDRSIALIKRAMRLSPYYPDWYRWTLGRAYRLAGQYKEAIAALATGLEESPASLLPRVELAATYSEIGRLKKARAQAAAVLKINPKFSVREWTQVPPYKDPAMTEREADALRRAGLPE